MRRDAKVLLVDVLTALDRATRFTANKSFDDYAKDELLRSAVERQLAIVGEALWQLRRLDPESAGRIRDIDQIVAFRHVFVHGYSSIDDLLVWGILDSRLASLAEDVRTYLDELAAGDP
jgi:uncharacterized protein with HEPN domain